MENKKQKRKITQNEQKHSFQGDKRNNLSGIYIIVHFYQMTRKIQKFFKIRLTKTAKMLRQFVQYEWLGP